MIELLVCRTLKLVHLLSSLERGQANAFSFAIPHMHKDYGMGTGQVICRIWNLIYRSGEPMILIAYCAEVHSMFQTNTSCGGANLLLDVP